METKTYPLYTLEFPASEEKSKNEPEYFQIVRWDNRTKLQKEVDRRTYFYFIGSSGVHLKDVLTDVLKFNEKAHDVPEEYLLEKLYVNNRNNSHFTELVIRMYISKYAHEYTKNPKNADKNLTRNTLLFVMQYITRKYPAVIFSLQKMKRTTSWIKMLKILIKKKWKAAETTLIVLNLILMAIQQS